MNRTTWFAVPIAGLAAVSLGLGWWGSTQHSQRAAMAAEIDNRYSNSFHELASHVQDLHREIGKTRITTDAAMFQERLRHVWRLSSLTQDEVGKIPLEMMPLHQTQASLANISKQTDNWLQASIAPTAPSVQSGLDKMYKETATMGAKLDDLQTSMMTHNLHWTTALVALDKGKKDNQIIDGFRKLDKSMGAFVEADKLETHPTAALNAFKNQKKISVQQARDIVTRYFQGSSIVIQNATKIHDGQLNYNSYNITGKISNHPFEADVSQSGGHLLYYRIDRTPATATNNFGQAKAAALRFLTQHGFSHLTSTDAYQFDHTGYFVFAPIRGGAVVLNQRIVVQTGLDNPTLPLGVNAQQFYLQPVRALPQRRYTAKQLQTVVNPKGKIEMTQKTIVLDAANKYQPAVSFYVTRDGDTYRIDVNAATGKEIETTDLTTK